MNDIGISSGRRCVLIVARSDLVRTCVGDDLQSNRCPLVDQVSGRASSFGFEF